MDQFSNDTFTTFFAAPSGFPSILLNVSAFSTNVTVNWSHIDCIDQNSEITGYSVSYYQGDGDGEEGIEEVVVMGTNDSDRIYTATRLHPQTRYNFEVAAVNNYRQRGPTQNLTVITSIPEGKLDVTNFCVQCVIIAFLFSCSIPGTTHWGAKLSRMEGKTCITVSDL